MSKPSLTPSADVPIWKLKSAIFTAVFPTGYDPDWALVKEVREQFDPHFVPLFMVRDYKPPHGSDLQFAYYVIGRWTPSIDEDQEGRPPLNVTRPSKTDEKFPFVGGYIYDQRTWSYQWPKGSWGAKMNIPEIYRPFDRRTIEWMREAHYSLLRSSVSVREQWEKRQREIEDQELRELQKIEDAARQKLLDDAEATKAIKEGTLNTPYEVEISTPHVQAEKVMEGTRLLKEMD